MSDDADDHRLPRIKQYDPEEEELAEAKLVHTPGSFIEEITSPDEPEDHIDDLPLPGESAKLLTNLQRRAILGKLAEFELLLSRLTLRQQNFVLAYLNDPTNTYLAAKTAGYSESSARQEAGRLIRHPRIMACIAAGQLLREDRTMVTADRTLNELAIIAFSDVTDYEFDPTSHEVKTRPGVPSYALRAVSQVEFTVTTREGEKETTTTEKTKIKLWSKTDALRMLALYQKLLGTEGGGVVINDQSVHNHQHNTWQFGDRKVQF